MKTYSPKHGSNGCLSVIAGILAAITIIVGVAACGGFSEANSYNLPDSSMTNYSHVHWYRIDSPSNYPTIIFGCLKGNGIYEHNDATSSQTVVPNDPLCAAGAVKLQAYVTRAASCKVADVLALVKWNIVRDMEPGPTGFLYRVRAFAEYRRLCDITAGNVTIYLQFLKHPRLHPHEYTWVTKAHDHFSMIGSKDKHLRMNLPLVPCTGSRGSWRIKLHFSPGRTSDGGYIAPENDYLPSENNGNRGIYLNCKN